MLEAAITLIAKAIISQVSAMTARTLGTALGDRLRGRPAERAVSAALRDALAQTEATYPRAVAELFDEHFLLNRGAPVLARYLMPGEPPLPEELVERWSAQLPTRVEM